MLETKPTEEVGEMRETTGLLFLDSWSPSSLQTIGQKYASVQKDMLLPLLNMKFLIMRKALCFCYPYVGSHKKIQSVQPNFSDETVTGLENR